MTGFENEGKLSDYANCLPIDSKRFLYLGDFRSAVSWKLLQDAGITSIVNCTTKVNNLFESYFEYHNVAVNDLPTVNLFQSHLDAATDFIQQSSGNVLVHCMAGKSRSVTIAAAYLIRYQGCTRHQAIRQIQCHRPTVRPNDGFLRQLSIYEYQCNPHRIDYYDMEWGREAMKFYETFGLPDVDARYADRILPIVIRVTVEIPNRSTTAWFQAVWNVLEQTMVKEEPPVSRLYHLQQQCDFIPPVRTSKSF